MPEEQRHTRVQDFIQGGLILILIVLLLGVGAVAIGYMARSYSSDYKVTVTTMAYDARLKTMETTLLLRIDRVAETAQNDSFTTNKRLELLEERMDTYEETVSELLKLHKKEK